MRTFINSAEGRNELLDVLHRKPEVIPSRSSTDVLTIRANTLNGAVSKAAEYPECADTPCHHVYAERVVNLYQKVIGFYRYYSFMKTK